ncbi:MAG: carbohydrate ABC transporter permease [Oscillospiraceae bacterium]|nr:carbohydrate ABC transporter permease [Oscillospiraceae bacterium]
MKHEKGHDQDLDFFSALIGTGHELSEQAKSTSAHSEPGHGHPSDQEEIQASPVRAISDENVYFTADPSEDEGPVLGEGENSAGVASGEGTGRSGSLGPTLEAADSASTSKLEEEGSEPSVFDELNEKVEKKHRLRRVTSLNRHVILNKIVIGIFFVIVLIAAVLAVLPIVLTILNSFMDSAEIRNHYSAIYESLSGYTGDKTRFVANPELRFVPDMVSLDQYATLLFKTPAYLLKFWNSVLIVVPIVVGQMAVGSLAAFAFARYRKKWFEAIFFSYIILMLMPHQVTLVPNLFIADSLGILDTWWAIILPGIFSTFSVFLLSKYMRQIPTSYIEAAKLDGAGEWHIFWSICLPMCKSALYAMSILLFIDYWNMVEQPLLMLKNQDLYPMSVFLSQINQKELGVAFAASTIFMIPPLLMFFNGEEYLIEGISRSGIK